LIDGVCRHRDLFLSGLANQPSDGATDGGEDQADNNYLNVSKGETAWQAWKGKPIAIPPRASLRAVVLPSFPLLRSLDLPRCLSTKQGDTSVDLGCGNTRVET